MHGHLYGLGNSLSSLPLGVGSSTQLTMETDDGKEDKSSSSQESVDSQSQRGSLDEPDPAASQ